MQGRHPEAIEQARQAVQIDPLSLNANIYLAQALFNARQYDQTIEQVRKMLELDQNFWWAHTIMGEVYERKGQFPEAV
ncbi:MAG: tetratricopeptide repeat protein, partial [Pyrinomonadaceae bacterium]